MRTGPRGSRACSSLVQSRARLQSPAAFGIGGAAAHLHRRTPTLFGCGCSSGVEHNLAKVGVVGSNPIARSKNRFGAEPCPEGVIILPVQFVPEAARTR